VAVPRVQALRAQALLRVARLPVLLLGQALPAWVLLLGAELPWAELSPWAELPALARSLAENCRKPAPTRCQRREKHPVRPNPIPYSSGRNLAFYGAVNSTRSSSKLPFKVSFRPQRQPAVM
jgi:hypothetical protein